MKNKEIKVNFNILAIILIIIFSCAISPKTLQNDTFYTIKIGEHILNNGIDMKDPFSWHDISYTYPHWAYDVMIYLIYNIGGQLGIYISTMLFASILGIVLYLTNTKLMKNKITSFVIAMFSMYLLKPYIAARAQLFTFILFALTIYFIEMFLETKKKKYAAGLIAIPILLANFHLAVFPFYFILYMPYIGEYIVYILSHAEIIYNKSKIKKLNKKMKNENEKELTDKVNILEERNRVLINRKEKVYSNPYKIVIKGNDTVKLLILILLICLFTGFLTPLGTTPYTYLVKTMQGNTTSNISEHLPLTLIRNIKFMVSLIFFVAILMFTDTKIRLCDLFMLGGLVALTFYSQRQESMFIICCSYVFNRLICNMFEKYSPNTCTNLETMATKLLNSITLTTIVLIISILLYKNKIHSDYIDEKSYPVQASEWILNNLDIENIKLYNEYNFGSYLLFKGIPVFIDSRADLYTPEFNGKGMDIFSDFLNISSFNCNIDEKINQYGFTHFIIPKNAKLRKILELKDNYEELYEDENFCILKRNNI